MPMPTLSFLIGLVVLGYLLTFVVFAILRIVTGVSIQRVGYSGFRRIAFSPRPGLKVHVRGVGLSIHRPTFAQPTWCSLTVTELLVTLDLKVLSSNGKENQHTVHEKANGGPVAVNGHPKGADGASENECSAGNGYGRTWKKLTEIKEKIKRVQRQIQWLRLIDLVAVGTTVNVLEVGKLQVARITLSVDTRSKTVDRSRLFQHSKAKPESQAPAEWRSLVRSVLFTPEGRESTEVLDYATLNIHGLLHRELEGLRDASISLKVGRLNVPYDDLEHAITLAKGLRSKPGRTKAPDINRTHVTITQTLHELNEPSSEADSIVQTVSDFKEFISSVLRGIQEIQLAIGVFGVSRKLEVMTRDGQHVCFNLAMKELGMDVLRLDSRSPAHRMYFSHKDVAHQALLTAIAISAGLDNGHEHPERMLYVPMCTATVKTTLPSKTIQYSGDSNVGERNSNILFANLVCTSPSFDLNPKHLPLVLEIMKGRSGPKTPANRSSRHHLISRLLPKANVKISIQEPVIRVSLPPMDRSNVEADDYDLLISSVSSMSMEIESSHATEGQAHYGLATNYRHTAHQLYYQTAAGDRHDLLQSDTVELKVQVHAIPDLSVVASGRFQTFTLYLNRPDICEGIRQIVQQLRKDVLINQGAQRPKRSFLRRMPSWLDNFQIEGADFGLELSGVDPQVSKETRGFALSLDSWSTEYKARRDEAPDMLARRKSISKPPPKGRHLLRTPSPSSLRRQPQSAADGRRLAVHLSGLEGFIIDSIEESEPDRFLTLPRFEVAFSTSTDHQGPLFHINSHANSLSLQYSLYNHFALGVAVLVIDKTFLSPFDRKDSQEPPGSMQRRSSLTVLGEAVMSLEDEIGKREVTTIDIKANLAQLKAKMPADPPLMLQVFGLEAGRHRWAAPFARSRIARLYAKAPSTPQVWSRLVTIRTLRLDLREVNKKTASKQYVNEKSIDITSEIIRFSIPHQLVVHNIFDNVTNVIKTTKQLQHHFMTGTNEYVLVNKPEGPKNVPRINVRSSMIVFDIEDSIFDSKLAAIYRTGLLEQRQRLAREEVFKGKCKKLEATGRHRGKSGFRTQSARRGQRERSSTRVDNIGKRRSRSNAPHTGDSPLIDHDTRHRKMRYDSDGRCGLSDNCQRTIEEAREKLMTLNAQSWKHRIDRVLNSQDKAIGELRALFWGPEDNSDEGEQQEQILALSQRPGLMTICITELNVTVDKPSFPVKEYPRFLHDVGKGMPYDMKYGLLIPMNIHVTMSEARLHLRDYPLPLLHVPPIAPGQSARLPSLSLRTDFVIAEEFRGFESQRNVTVVVVPPEKFGPGECRDGKGFAVDVRRTISPVKTYSDMKIDINTSSATKITWGTSYQPAIQEMMQVIEGFTKPPIDPSDRVGFWDKIRLSFHSRVDVAWRGDGDVHLILKGSRDPYVVTGQGAGFVMVWRNDVRWNIAQDNDPRKFMTVDSAEYILAVPDFNHYARRVPEIENDDDMTSSGSTRGSAIFKKVIMKLSGNVRWLSGMKFERTIGEKKRSFEFKPHYNVVLKHPDFAKAPEGEVYDGYRGFRSHHIHLSIAVAAPHDRDWSVSNLKPSHNYNSVHLSPRAFSHFFSWWSMFSGVMSLPIRQGPLWGAQGKSSKKFGRHLATIKYSLLLSPLFISHIYKHKDAEDYTKDVVSATGLKLRLDSFMLDLHQRREVFDIKGHEGITKKSSGMRINQSQLDFISADMRAVSSSIGGTNANDLDKATDETLSSLGDQMPRVDISKFTIPDNDLTWIDMDDFVELDWILPAESNPETKILPLGYAPRFTYFRQTDHGDSVAGDTTRSSSFGDEPTHYCVMSGKNDPGRVQVELIEGRLKRLEEQRIQNQRALGHAELKVVRSVTGDKTCQARLDTLRVHNETLLDKVNFLESMLERLTRRLERDDPSAIPELETSDESFETPEHARKEHHATGVDSAPLTDYTSEFNNRFVVHNAQIKWNNSLRNIILRYGHQVSQRRGFVYYMSRRAVKFILDILEEQKKSDGVTTPTPEKTYSQCNTPLSPDEDDELTVQDRIFQLLRDGREFVRADDKDRPAKDDHSEAGGAGDDIAVEFTALNTFHFRLIAPQIQLQSEKNPKSAVLVTAKGMQLKVIQIMDKDRVTDDISGLVQRRFTAAMDSLQMYVTSSKTFSTEYLHMYSDNSYGAKAGTYWPPWVPLEVMFEFQIHPYGFDRVVLRTSASLRYDKFNTLRLKYNDDVTGGDKGSSRGQDDAGHRMDHVWLEFPHFRAICDSAQYYALYIIVMDLLLYSEPLGKTRSERLEKIMLASDFSDLTGAPEMVQMLQERIRQLEEIKRHFQINEKYLDRQGWKDRISMDQDLASCEDELFFIMKAITTAQRHNEDRSQQDQATGMLRLSMSASEIAWHLIRDKGESLLEFQLKNASFDRVNHNDGSNYNCMEIGRINGFNLLQDAIYPEIVAPYINSAKGFAEQDAKMLRVHWLMLEAIAGIPVVDHFEVNVVPLKVQLERDVAKKLFEYIFPGVGGSAFEGGGFSPFMVKNILPTQEEEDEDSDEKQGSEPSGISSDVANPESDDTQANHIGSNSGALEVRLMPTLNLPEKGRRQNKGLGIATGNAIGSHTKFHNWGLFQHSDKTRTTFSRKALGNANSPTSSFTNLAALSRSPSERSLATRADSMVDGEKHKRFPLHRSISGDKKKNKQRSDDLTQMMNRASNYMTLASVKIPSVVLCLSYKGKGQRNLEDVHDLVFRMPALEYRNKTWSNLDLALQLKKDVIRALISHAGAIVGNKFKHHGSSRQAQSKLRELANRSTLMSIGDGSSAPSEASSMRDSHGTDGTPRQSFTSGRGSTLSRSLSNTPSSQSLQFSGTPETEDVPRPQSKEEARPRSKDSPRQLSKGASKPQSPFRQGDPDSRARTSSISRHLSGFGQRLRPTDSNNVEEADDNKRKNKMLSGGQRFLRSLQHP